jgi:hypothetical protein
MKQEWKIVKGSKNGFHAGFRPRRMLRIRRQSHGYSGFHAASIQGLGSDRKIII